MFHIVKAYLLHNKITDATGNIFTNRKSSKNQVKKYRYYNLKSLYLPAGDIEKITRDVVQSFLNSDMNSLPEATRLAFKEVQYDEAIIRPLIERVIYQENRLTYFINVSDISYLEPFKQGILNARAEALSRSYLSSDDKFIVIEKPIFISKGVASNRYSGGEHINKDRER